MTIEEFLTTREQPEYRRQQFYQAYYQNYIESFSDLTTWPVELRRAAEQSVFLEVAIPLELRVSAEKDTLKVLFERKSAPGQKLETVLMRHHSKRNTVCVSCMVGCPMNCTFCATGTMGFISNLTAEEIVAQVLYFARLLKKEKQNITNVVFMGMGEPLANLANTQAAIAVLTDKKKFGLGTGRITVSTCGITSALKKFINDGYKGRLAISLHAPNQTLREQIMPSAKSNYLDELLTAIDLYVKKTNKRVSYEYILLKGINDQLEQAEKLARLLRHRLAHVNLIPYNPVRGKEYTPPDKKQIFAFAAVLKKYGIPHTIRVTMGADIQAACGQLVTKL